jgi:hypothetical protein
MPAATQPHSRLCAYFSAREAEWDVVASVKRKVRVSSVRSRTPGVCAVLGHARGEEVLTHPPFLCVEISGKNDGLVHLFERLDDFRGMGVENIWVINPHLRRGYRYTTEGLMVAKDGVMRTSNPAISVPLDAIFE